MEEIKKQLDKELRNESELISYYLEAIEIRTLHPELSEEIAREVFDQTHPSTLPFIVNDDTQRLRDEFGALEAPGLPDDYTNPDVYREQLWQRLKYIVNENRTV